MKRMLARGGGFVLPPGGARVTLGTTATRPHVGTRTTVTRRTIATALDRAQRRAKKDRGSLALERAAAHVLAPIESLIYLRFRRRQATHPRPMTPVPSIASVLGSGTVNSSKARSCEKVSMPGGPSIGTAPGMWM